MVVGSRNIERAFPFVCIECGSRACLICPVWGYEILSSLSNLIIKLGLHRLLTATDGSHPLFFCP